MVNEDKKIVPSDARGYNGAGSRVSPLLHRCKPGALRECLLFRFLETEGTRIVVRKRLPHRIVFRLKLPKLRGKFFRAINRVRAFHNRIDSQLNKVSIQKKCAREGTREYPERALFRSIYLS